MIAARSRTVLGNILLLPKCWIKRSEFSWGPCDYMREPELTACENRGTPKRNECEGSLDVLHRLWEGSLQLGDGAVVGFLLSPKK